MSAITAGGDLIHYEVLGHGRPVILVHGWLGSWRYWVPTIQQLYARFRVYALDLYGFGDSAHNPAKYSIEHQVELLADFMRELGVPKAALIGHGLGAIVAAEFSRRYPDRVPRLMLVSAPLFDPGNLDTRIPASRRAYSGAKRRTQTARKVELSPDAPTVMSASAAMRAALLEAARNRSNGGETPVLPTSADMTLDREQVLNEHRHNPLVTILPDLETMLGRAFRRADPEYEKLAVDVARTDSRVLHRSVTSFDSGQMLDTLRLLTMPTVVVHGLDDPILPAPTDPVLNYVTLDQESHLLPIVMQGVRHFPMLEHDRFFRLLTDFLEAPDISRLELKERWRRRTR